MFYGLFLAELNKEFSDDFPTACVSKHKSSSNINLIIGKKFWEKTLYNDSRKMSILIHELEHVVREHLSEFSSGMFPNKYIANIAMDISINQCIVEELPRTDENGEKCGVYIEDFAELKLEENQSSLYYYNQLMKAKEKKENCKGDKDSKNPNKCKGNKLGTSGSKALDEILDNIEAGVEELTIALMQDVFDIYQDEDDYPTRGVKAGEPNRFVIKNKESYLNIVCQLEPGDNEFTLTVITVMRKQDFKPYRGQFVLEV
jgi:hypothetical protein